MREVLAGIEIVYYVRHRGHIKIGMTQNLANRVGSLSVGLGDVLAYEFGGRELERARHAQFADAHATGDGLSAHEHFHLTPALEAHIATLMAEAMTRVKPTLMVDA